MDLNKTKIWLLLALIFTPLILLGFVIFNVIGAIFTIIISIMLSSALNRNSDRIILKMYSAKKTEKEKYLLYHKIVEDIAKKTGIKEPKLYIIESKAPNIFTICANGKRTGIIVTESLLQICSDKELESVIAHEFGHIKYRDSTLMTLVGAIAGAITFAGELAIWTTISDDNVRHPISMIPLIMLAPFSAIIIHLWIPKNREYRADEFSVNITGQTKCLISALNKLSAEVRYRPIRGLIHGTSHMFIVNPLTGLFSSIFCTHPPIKTRIDRLEKMKI